MSSSIRFAWRVALFGAVMAVLLVLIVQAIRRPVTGPVDAYTAVFTDADGLRAGDDVRMVGMQVGKVVSLRLDDGAARVRFTVRRDHPIRQGATLAIRYQSLAGQRYVDIRQPERATATLAPGATIGPDHTVPSFDITALFNGLQPVLAQASPDAVNRLAQSLLAVLDGDGSGLGRALDAVDQLGGYVSDRQAVIATLIHNLRQISDVLAGRSPHLVALIGGLADVFEALEQKLQGVVDFAETVPPVLQPLDELAARLGLTPDTNRDIDTALRAALPDPAAARDVLSRLPGLLQTLDALASGPADAVTVACSKGSAPAPAPLAVLIAGQRITICKC
ncbi:MlaD family protein [Nocardia terpenica]|uniref:Mammalian cell entry protein n=1 Tax=Nocardia terpenica TaxID=455432 RepID=A0A164PT91_9NOCA|nr:MlaD family protein [Nocardia terpenica]KZM76036.1 mammalian cell entry protein [Nocardia terpenica]NQE85587.1 MCE family protein [Nocardia terpenica]